MNKKKKALSLVELMVSAVIIAMISYVVLQVYVTNQRFIEQNKNEIEARTSVRQVYWYLKHDLREAFTQPASYNFTSVGDELVINSLAGNITYRFSSRSDDGYVLERQGKNIAYDIDYLALSNTTNGVDIDIVSHGKSFYGRPYTIQLKQLINKRN